MSGIIGKVSFDPREPLALATLEQMLEASARSHDRGRALYQAPGIALGSCAPADGGANAVIVSGRSATLHACACASLTNAAVLRSELEHLGHHFLGTADDELILRAYEQWGHAAFARLRGPFVCAIWDSLERRLVLARDHVGVRPLYFALLPDHGVVFASDIRALLRDPGVGRRWCPAGIDAYLTLGYVPAPLTAYQRISKLEAAHLLLLEGRRLHVEPFWDVPGAARSTEAESEAIARIAETVRRAVAVCGSAGHRPALLYSGGVASTSLLAAAPDAIDSIVTVAFEHEETSELVRSGRAASMLGRAREIESAPFDGASLARQLAAACEEPVGDPAAVSQLALCQAVGRQATFALAAHGAATLWAGAARHRVEHLESMARAWLRWPLASLGAELGRTLPESVKGARALAHLGLPPAAAYAVKHAYGLWDDDHRRTLYTRRFAWEVRESNPFARHLDLYASRGTGDAIDRALYVDAHTFLPDSIVPMANAAARAAGVRLHLPMLDVDLVECAASTATALKRRGPAGMYALRAVLARQLPPSLLPPARRVPDPHAWLRRTLAAMVPAVLLGPRCDERGIVSRPVLRQLWNEHQHGKRDHAHRLWSLLMLELWLRDAIDGNAAEVPIEYAILAPRRPAARTGTPTLKAA